MLKTKQLGCSFGFIGFLEISWVPFGVSCGGQTGRLTNNACVHGSTNGNNGIPISFKVLTMVPLVKTLVPMVPLEKKTDYS